MRSCWAQLKRRIRPLVLRRVREHVAADLPAKQEQVVEVELHPRHRKIYQRQLQRERQKVLGLIGDMNANRFAIFRSLTLLRQLSLHAGLIDDAYADVPSSKIDALLGQLQDVLGGGHRALVFSQFTGFLALVRAQLDAAGIPYCYLDGKTRDRPAVLQAFKNGPAPVFLISLKAGGVWSQPHRGRLLLPAGSVAESGDGDPGGRPDAPHRADTQRDGVPAYCRLHHRGEGDGAQEAESRAVHQCPGQR